MTGFIARDELEALGLASLGEDVSVDRTVRLLNPHKITLGDRSRIDAGTVLSAGEGGISIGAHVHVSVFCFLAGAAPIVVEDFAGLSARTTVLSSNDDYSGATLTGPTVPGERRAVHSATVVVGSHVVVGVGSVVLPGVTIGRGAAVGALSLVKRDVAPLTIVAGPRGGVVGTRSEQMFELARDLTDDEH